MARSWFVFGASTLDLDALASSFYADSDYNHRIISILPQSDQEGSTVLTCMCLPSLSRLRSETRRNPVICLF